MCWPRSKSMSCPPEATAVPVEGAIHPPGRRDHRTRLPRPRHEKDNWIKLLRIQGVPGRVWAYRANRVARKRPGWVSTPMSAPSRTRSTGSRIGSAPR